MPITSFEDYVDKTNYATTKEELFSLFLQTVNRHGLDRALFALMTDHDDLGEKAGVGVIHNFPSDWMSHYFEGGYDKIDPVIVYGASKVDAYTWREIPQHLKLTTKQKACLNYGAEAGLKNGVATYLRAPRNQLAGISLASSEQKDSFDGNVDLITAYCNHFYLRYRRLQKIADPPPPNICLTVREREILKWFKAGKNIPEISTILTISDHVIDFHTRNIFRKLDAGNKTLAVVKAIDYGLI